MYLDKATLIIIMALMIIGLGLLLFVLREMGHAIGLSHSEPVSEGPELGQVAPPFSFRDAETGEHLHFPADVVTVRWLVFADPGCSSCEGLLTELATASARDLNEVLVVTTAPKAVVSAYPGFNETNLSVARVGPRVRQLYNVHSSPFGVRMDDKGVADFAGPVHVAADLHSPSIHGRHAH
jgi:hypothetical protein